MYILTICRCICLCCSVVLLFCCSVLWLVCWSVDLCLRLCFGVRVCVCVWCCVSSFQDCACVLCLCLCLLVCVFLFALLARMFVSACVCGFVLESDRERVDEWEWVFRYRGPPELFTMYACLFADSSVQKVSTMWLVSHTVVMRTKCLSYMSEHGFPPHPGVLIEMIRSGE